jgi:small subunit ribosomal protein S5
MFSHSRGECTIKVDHVQKPERGNSTISYHALVIGGNGNSATGSGIGKALSPNKAIFKACKHCKRNVFYVDWYINSGLSYDLAGMHNSCRVRLRDVSPNYSLHGHPLIVNILKYAGVSGPTGKSRGNQYLYNVVYATLKALMTHKSLEEIAMKRGKKLLNLQRARRLGI